MDTSNLLLSLLILLLKISIFLCIYSELKEAKANMYLQEIKQEQDLVC